MCPLLSWDLPELISMTVPHYYFFLLFLLCDGLKIVEEKYLEILIAFYLITFSLLGQLWCYWENSYRKSKCALNKYYLPVMKMTVMAKEPKFTSTAECKKRSIKVQEINRIWKFIVNINLLLKMLVSKNTYGGLKLTDV